MRWSFSTLGLIAFGLCGIIVIVLFQSVTVGNEQDYYLLKEATEAAMIDSIDLAYYRDTGKFKMVQEKFVENFTRRYAEVLNINNSEGFTLEFYNIIEMPPKVSVVVKNNLGTYRIWNHISKYSISNSLDAVLEADDSKLPKNFDNKCKTIYARYYSMTFSEPGEVDSNWQNLVPPAEAAEGFKADKVKFIRRILGMRDYREHYLGEYEQMYGRECNPGGSVSGDTCAWYDNINPNNFAKNFQLTFFDSKFDESNKVSQMRWKGIFECENTDGASGKCGAGFIYDVTWRQYENCEVVEEEELEDE